MRCFRRQHETALFCTIGLLLLHLQINDVATDAPPSLRLLHILYRHGDRTPIDPYPNDAYLDYWTEGYGQLTNIGKQQHLSLGQYLRQKYKGFLNESYHFDEVLINSTNVDRTLMSALSNLAGLYPPVADQVWDQELLWQPIPVHTLPTYIDYIIDPDAHCPKYDKVYNEVLASPEMQQIDQENADLFALVTNESGRNITNVFELNKIYDTIMIEKLYNLSQPSWVDPVYDQMHNLSDLSFEWRYITEEEKRLKGGPLVKHIIHNIGLRINGTDEKRKAYIFSGHDTSVAAFLSALNLFNNKAPPYASAVLVELHTMSSGSGYGVQVLYRNSTNVDPYVLTLPNCTALCPLDQFVALTAAVVPDNVIKECELDADFFSNIDWTATSVLIVLIAAIIAAVIGCVVYSCKRKNVGYQYTMVNTE